MKDQKKLAQDILVVAWKRLENKANLVLDWDDVLA